MFKQKFRNLRSLESRAIAITEIPSGTVDVANGIITGIVDSEDGDPADAVCTSEYKQTGKTTKRDSITRVSSGIPMFSPSNC